MATAREIEHTIDTSLPLAEAASAAISPVENLIREGGILQFIADARRTNVSGVTFEIGRAAVVRRAGELRDELGRRVVFDGLNYLQRRPLPGLLYEGELIVGPKAAKQLKKGQGVDLGKSPFGNLFVAALDQIRSAQLDEVKAAYGVEEIPQDQMPESVMDVLLRVVQSL